MQSGMRKIIFVLLAVAALAFIAGYLLAPRGALLTAVPGVYSVKLALPAVDSYGRGALAELTVEAANGEAGVYYQVDDQNPLVNPETQESLKTAVAVAREVTGMQDKRLFYSISAPSQVVGGHSAGAALAVATTAALSNSKIKQGYLVTGTVEADGSIGRVGEILAKAQAAKDAGYSVLLVPVGEAVYDAPRQNCTEERTPTGLFKTCVTLYETAGVTNETGMQVVEVASVRQAFGLMRQ